MEHINMTSFLGPITASSSFSARVICAHPGSTERRSWPGITKDSRKGKEGGDYITPGERSVFYFQPAACTQNSADIQAGEFSTPM